MPNLFRYAAPRHAALLVAVLLLASPATLLQSASAANAAPAYQYLRIGSPQDAVTLPEAGFALMGGGSDLDEAFRWLCNRAHGGDFLILRATGNGDYNPYVAGLEDGTHCKLNSVATLILPSRNAASGPNAAFVAQTIAHAEAIFIAGGDQANYIRNWTGTAVQRELNAAIQRGIPLGGTSAGLAVLGEWAYSAEGDKPDDPNLDSKTALADPLSPRITLAHGFLTIPILKGIITDSHFARRNRMGRLLVFLARIHAENPAAENPTRTISGLGIEEGAAVLAEPDGRATVVGRGAAYFLGPVAASPETPPPGRAPLQLPGMAVQKVAPGKSFNLRDWQGDAIRYSLTVSNGQLHSTQADGSFY